MRIENLGRLNILYLNLRASLLNTPTYNGVCSCMWGPFTWERLEYRRAALFELIGWTM